MKDHFLKLFKYDRYSNLQIVKMIAEANQPDKPVQLMAHLLAAQQIWLQRCKALPASGGAIWPLWKAEAFTVVIEENFTGWNEYLNNLTDNDFEHKVNYSNSRGEQFCNKLSDVLAHLINHGTHHRSQIGQQLKLAGLDTLPGTDYIFYLREQKQ